MNDKVLLCRDLMGDHGQSRWPDQAESTDQEVRICDWLHSEEERVRLNDALQLWIGVMHPSVCTCCLTRCLHLTVLMLSNRGMSGDVSLFDSSAVAVATWSTQWLGGPCDILQEKKPRVKVPVQCVSCLDGFLCALPALSSLCSFTCAHLCSTHHNHLVKDATGQFNHSKVAQTQWKIHVSERGRLPCFELSNSCG